MKVIKFGGTSVGNSENIKNVVKIICGTGKKIVVFSAMSGTTDSLICAINHAKGGNLEKARFVFEDIFHKYVLTAYELINKRNNINEFLSFLENRFNYLDHLISKPLAKTEENHILSQGEFITVELIKYYLNELQIRVVIMPALEIIQLNDQDNPDYTIIENKMKCFLENYPDENFFITQGFICKNHCNEIDNLKRGGSDYTATILGSVCNAEEIQIWSDIDGLHNNDPRYVPLTKSVKKLSYEEAEELAYFGAKVLHPTCINPAKLKNIPILLKNTLNLTAEGTSIYNFKKSYGIKAIAAKDGIIALKIHSGRMLHAYGFLKKIFEIFAFHKTPVDMITTSEVSVSVTIDNPAALAEIIKDLTELGTVEVFPEQSIICIVGNFKSEVKGIISDVLQCINHIPVRMLSYGASENNLSLLVNEIHKKEILNSLHIHLFSDNKISMSLIK